jgi:tRNA U34 2-thiouridine synthase MnmA/TrmU
MYATIGQGAKISGASQKWFVVDKQYCNTTTTTTTTPKIYVCSGTHHLALYADRLYVQQHDMNWMMGGRPPPLPFRAKCRIRHLQPLVDCEIVLLTSGHWDCSSVVAEGRAMYEVRLAKPLRGIARGQVCAIYAGGNDGSLICLGGGPIHRRGRTFWEMQQDLPGEGFLHPSGHNDYSYLIS